jgi:hypothetical protein
MQAQLQYANKKYKIPFETVLLKDQIALIFEKFVLIYQASILPYPEANLPFESYNRSSIEAKRLESAIRKRAIDVKRENHESIRIKKSNVKLFVDRLILDPYINLIKFYKLKGNRIHFIMPSINRKSSVFCVLVSNRSRLPISQFKNSSESNTDSDKDTSKSIVDAVKQFMRDRSINIIPVGEPVEFDKSTIYLRTNEFFKVNHPSFDPLRFNEDKLYKKYKKQFINQSGILIFDTIAKKLFGNQRSSLGKIGHSKFVKEYRKDDIGSKVYLFTSIDRKYALIEHSNVVVIGNDREYQNWVQHSINRYNQSILWIGSKPVDLPYSDFQSINIEDKKFNILKLLTGGPTDLIDDFSALIEELTLTNNFQEILRSFLRNAFDEIPEDKLFKTNFSDLVQQFSDKNARISIDDAKRRTLNTSFAVFRTLYYLDVPIDESQSMIDEFKVLRHSLNPQNVPKNDLLIQLYVILLYTQSIGKNYDAIFISDPRLSDFMLMNRLVGNTRYIFSAFEKVTRNSSVVFQVTGDSSYSLEKKLNISEFPQLILSKNQKYQELRDKIAKNSIQKIYIAPDQEPILVAINNTNQSIDEMQRFGKSTGNMKSRAVKLEFDKFINTEDNRRIESINSETPIVDPIDQSYSSKLEEFFYNDLIKVQDEDRRVMKSQEMITNILESTKRIRLLQKLVFFDKSPYKTAHESNPHLTPPDAVEDLDLNIFTNNEYTLTVESLIQDHLIDRIQTGFTKVTQKYIITKRGLDYYNDILQRIRLLFDRFSTSLPELENQVDDLYSNVKRLTIDQNKLSKNVYLAIYFLKVNFLIYSYLKRSINRVPYQLLAISSEYQEKMIEFTDSEILIGEIDRSRISISIIEAESNLRDHVNAMKQNQSEDPNQFIDQLTIPVPSLQSPDGQSEENFVVKSPPVDRSADSKLSGSVMPTKKANNQPDEDQSLIELEFDTEEETIDKLDKIGKIESDEEEIEIDIDVGEIEIDINNEEESVDQIDGKKDIWEEIDQITRQKRSIIEYKGVKTIYSFNKSMNELAALFYVHELLSYKSQIEKNDLSQFIKERSLNLKVKSLKYIKINSNNSMVSINQSGKKLIKSLSKSVENRELRSLTGNYFKSDYTLNSEGSISDYQSFLDFFKNKYELRTDQSTNYLDLYNIVKSSIQLLSRSFNKSVDTSQIIDEIISLRVLSVDKSNLEKERSIEKRLIYEIVNNIYSFLGKLLDERSTQIESGDKSIEKSTRGTADKSIEQDTLESNNKPIEKNKLESNEKSIELSDERSSILDISGLSELDRSISDPTNKIDRSKEEVREESNSQPEIVKKDEESDNQSNTTNISTEQEKGISKTNKSKKMSIKQEFSQYLNSKKLTKAEVKKYQFFNQLPLILLDKSSIEPSDKSTDEKAKLSSIISFDELKAMKLQYFFPINSSVRDKILARSPDISVEQFFRYYNQLDDFIKSKYNFDETDLNLISKLEQSVLSESADQVLRVMNKYGSYLLMINKPINSKNMIPKSIKSSVCIPFDQFMRNEIIDSLQTIDRSDVIILKFLDTLIDHWTNLANFDTTGGKSKAKLRSSIRSLRKEWQLNYQTVNEYNKLQFEETEKLLSQKNVLTDQCQRLLNGLFIDQRSSDLKEIIPDESFASDIFRSANRLGYAVKRRPIDPIRRHIEEFMRLSPGSIGKIQEINKLILAFIELQLETTIFKKL